MVVECHSVYLRLYAGRREVVETLRFLVVDQHHLHLVLPLSHSSVESHAVYPSCQVGFRDSSHQHTLKVHGEVKRHLVDEVGVGDYHVLAPFSWIVKNIVHGCKVSVNRFQNKICKGKICNFLTYFIPQTVNWAFGGLSAL